jgi:hypothetical protein
MWGLLPYRSLLSFLKTPLETINTIHSLVKDGFLCFCYSVWYLQEMLGRGWVLGLGRYLVLKVCPKADAAMRTPHLWQCADVSGVTGL